MFVARLGFLLLCATVVAERTRLQAAAIVTADISRCPLTNVPPILCSTQRQHQQQRHSSNWPTAQVVPERSSSCAACISAIDVSSSEHQQRRKCIDGTNIGTRTSSRETPHGRLQSPETTRSDSTSNLLRVNSRTADTACRSCDANPSRNERGERSSTGSGAGRQHAVPLSSFPLFSPSRTQTYLHGVATAIALQVKKNNSTNRFPIATRWHLHPCSHSISYRPAETYSSSAFYDICLYNDVVFPNVPLLYLSPADYSFASRSPSPSSVSPLATTYSCFHVHFAHASYAAPTRLRSLTSRLALLTTPSYNYHSPSSASSSACAHSSSSVTRRPLAASRACPSRLSLRSPLTVTTTTTSTSFPSPCSFLSAFSPTVRSSYALPPPHFSSVSSYVSRLRHPSSSLSSSLLSPGVQPGVRTERPKEFQEKLSFIASLVQNTPVVLFMKGTPTEPACGFSRVTYELLALASNQVNESIVQASREKSKDRSSSSTTEQHASTLSPPTPVSSSPHALLSDHSFFRSVNVLEDDLMREGIKQYSDWPTIPQLYISGQFVGGADITASMFNDKSLHKAIKSALLVVKCHSEGSK